ncbi:MAG TPA: class I SAM-dependent methyltransferase [Solirubrobacteraceae bacterium]|nr:class I SAM-dependent methyltransferase [Solirubrobacteraceae bacterium]
MGRAGAPEILDSVSDYYAGRLEQHGTTPAGVDWSSEDSQQLRFAELLKLIDWRVAPSLLDYGCGYGALAQLLCRGEREFSYVGFDLAEPMVEAARSLLDDRRCQFTADERTLSSADYALASGIFNVRLQTDETSWHAYIVEVLDSLASLSGAGFAFNMLTRYADPPLMRGDLYYADPARYFKLCKERYSRNVSVLHDYDLYEFTIHVRLGQPPKPLAD